MKLVLMFVRRLMALSMVVMLLVLVCVPWDRSRSERRMMVLLLILSIVLVLVLLLVLMIVLMLMLLITPLTVLFLMVQCSHFHHAMQQSERRRVVETVGLPMQCCVGFGHFAPVLRVRGLMTENKQKCVKW
jgi:succinate-acetate transporter protein